jgi:hypothetical protein
MMTVLLDKKRRSCAVHGSVSEKTKIVHVHPFHNFENRWRLRVCKKESRVEERGQTLYPNPVIRLSPRVALESL